MYVVCSYCWKSIRIRKRGGAKQQGWRFSQYDKYNRNNPVVVYIIVANGFPSPIYMCTSMYRKNEFLRTIEPRY